MNWWANRLGQQEQAAPPPPRPAPQPAPQPQQSNALEPQAPKRAPQSSQQTDLCPGCGSGNYFAAQGSQYQRCYDCGYPIQQSGTGVGSVQSDAPAKQAVQVKGGGFNPQQIIGRVE